MFTFVRETFCFSITIEFRVLGHNIADIDEKRNNAFTNCLFLCFRTRNFLTKLINTIKTNQAHHNICSLTFTNFHHIFRRFNLLCSNKCWNICDRQAKTITFIQQNERVKPRDCVLLALELQTCVLWTLLWILSSDIVATYKYYNPNGIMKQIAYVILIYNASQ